MLLLLVRNALKENDLALQRVWGIEAEYKTITTVAT
jgi:hypothetical protein